MYEATGTSACISSLSVHSCVSEALIRVCVCVRACMLEAPAEHTPPDTAYVCMYVSENEAFVYVWMSQTYIHSNLTPASWRALEHL